MTMEAFLVNPARRTRKRKTSGARKRKRGGGLPGGLLSRMIKTHGRKRGMSEAWKAYRTGARNPRKRLPAAYHAPGRKHRPVVYSGIRKGVFSRSPYSRSPQINPFGEEVMIVGANPKRRKRTRTRRRRSVNPIRRHRRSYSMKSNPVRRRIVRRRRGYRRNPATAIAISARRPMSLLMPALAGTGGFFVADYIPVAIGMSASPLTRIGVKAGVAFGGGMLVTKFMGNKSGTAFAIGAGINLINDVLRTYVFKTAATAGLGAFTRPSLRGMGAMSPYSNIRSPYAS
jgi:hypothetical protein